MNGYEVLYDLRRDWGAILWPIALLVGPAGVAVFLARLIWKNRKEPAIVAIVPAAAVIAFVASIFICGGLHGLLERRRLIDILESGEAQVVEGVVTGFVQIPPEGHDSEYWKVNGLDFAPYHGEAGRVREGLGVRVFYYDDPAQPAVRGGDDRVILRIEALPEAVDSALESS